MPEAVLFDLDGTLADTAPDLGGALNRLLAEEGRQALPLLRLRPHVSGGVRALLRMGFGIQPEDSGYAALQARFLDLYTRHICEQTTLFAGMGELLGQLERSGIPWGIVTNKAARYTQEVVRGLGLAERAACIVSGDSTARPKPSPDPLLLACQQVPISPAACIYVGDDLRDVQSGKAAGIATAIAAWGYLGDGPAIEEWGSDYIISHPAEILALL